MVKFYTHKIKINKEQSSHRLDQAITKLLNKFTRSQVKILIENNNVKTVATQERFFHTFYKAYAVIFDTYFVASEFTANLIKNSKYSDVKNLIPVGLYTGFRRKAQQYNG